MKKTLRNIFISLGFGTMIFLPMLILDNGLNDTLKSVLIWAAASVLYGLSFEIFKTKLKIKLPLHILICFAVTVTVRCLYSYFTDGTVKFSVILVTVPIFIAVYIVLYFFMKNIGDLDVQ